MRLIYRLEHALYNQPSPLLSVCITVALSMSIFRSRHLSHTLLQVPEKYYHLLLPHINPHTYTHLFYLLTFGFRHDAPPPPFCSSFRNIIFTYTANTLHNPRAEGSAGSQDPCCVFPCRCCLFVAAAPTLVFVHPWFMIIWKGILLSDGGFTYLCRVCLLLPSSGHFYLIFLAV